MNLALCCQVARHLKSSATQAKKRHAKRPAGSRVVKTLTFRHSQVGDHCFIHFSRLFTSCFSPLPTARVRLATKQMQVEPKSEQEGLD